MIEFLDVQYRYAGTDSNVLNGLSFRIPDQGVTSIMGANGSGKSTAALCMNGILSPTEGEVVVNGITTSRTGTLPEIRKSVGVVFQNPNRQFTSLTVERELAFGLESAGKSREEMVEKVEEFLGMFDLRSHRNAPPSALSGGEKQRVALAAVAITNPRYLVLDEATSLLSPGARRTILNLATEASRRQQTALVLITQFPEEALLAEHVLIFRSGFLELEGPPQEVLRDAARMKELGIPVPLSTMLGFHGI